MSRILFVTDSLFPLGPAKQLKILALALAERGHEIHIAAFEEPWETELVNYYEFANVHGLRKGEIRAGRQPILAARLRKLVRSIRPDIVHGWCDPAASVCGLALYRKDNIKFVATELWVRPEKPLTQYLFERRFHRRPDTITVPHDSLKQHLIEVHDVREHRLDIISNSIEPPTIGQPAARKRLRLKLGLKSTARIATTVAPLVSRTRLKDLIWATDLLACVIEDVHFVIFGKGIQEHKLRHFLGLTEASKVVHFMGHDPDVENLVRGADLYWHSHLREPQPTGLLHAMASDVPVVSVYGPETEGLIVPQVTGLATNFGARDEFARWTKYLLEIPPAGKQLATQGRVHVEKNFRVEQTFENYQNVYK